MPQKLVLKQKGLFTDPNQLSGLPEGAMVKAENVVIDRMDIVESRRGFAGYGNTFGLQSDRSKQLLVYKDRILIHYSDKLLFNDNPHNMLVDGDFQAFNGSYTETELGLRIKSAESNKNLFFTTNDGIKKISARTADDFTTSAGFIRDAGAAKALDVTGTLISTLEGFLPPNSEVAYRVVWSYKDLNDNLIVGSPSSRLVISNSSSSNANVALQFVIPQNVTSDYFYQVYRSAVFTATGSLTLDDIDPGDELQLVIEDFPTAGQITAGVVGVTDLAPEDFRQGGLPLYTNPNNGEGIGQANEPPPKAKDMTMYQSTMFYANIETRARTTLALLGVEDFISGTSSITIDNGTDPAQTYTFVGEKENTTVDFAGYTGTIPTDLDGTYFLLNSASDKRKYYVWFDNTKTEQILDFTNYIYSTPTDIKANIKEKFVVLYTPDPDVTYYVWFDSTGTDVNPGTDPNNGLVGYAGIRVDISSITSLNDLVVATEAAISSGDIDNDFDTAILLDVITVTSESFDDTAFDIIENIQSGFSFTFNTPTNEDPANFLDRNPDVVGRSGFRVNISRGITTKAQVADALAAAILEQDSASDFEVKYSTGLAIVGFGSPTLLTYNNHGLSNGDTITITNSDTTPSIDGNHVITFVNANSFTIPIVTSAGTKANFNSLYVDINNTNNGDTTDAFDGGRRFAASVVTLGNPTSINQTAHGLSNGDIITITASTTTPSINGVHTVSVVDANNFTIPFTTTVGGTADWRFENPVGNGFTITVTQQGDGEDASLQEVLLSAAVSPAQQIDETARSLVNVINKNPNETIYAYYISGANDLPGQILLEVKDIGVNEFTIIANSSATGASFNPSLPPVVGAAVVSGKAEIKPNRIYYAKLQQPEAVPLLNFIDVGPEDKAISRILALRESLFILKEDGVYRLTGTNGNYSVDLFDGSTKIIAPDSAVTVNNLIYCLTNLGIVTISDTGVTIISGPIKNTVQLLSSSSYNFKYTSFGVSYENDQSYLLWMPSSPLDTVATFAIRYATDNQAFTTYKLSKTCGLINPGDDKLYLGTNDTNYIERERKLFKRTDFADRQFDLIIPTNAVNGKILSLSSSALVNVGDAIVQTQYLTIAEYNQLLKKLDLDPLIGEAEITLFDFTSYTGSIPSGLHSKYFILYAASDSRRYAVFFDAQGDLPSLDTDVFNDISDAIQIRVDISSGVSTLIQLAEATKTAIQSATFDFVVTYVSGDMFFSTRTVRNGNTTDAFDSAVNGLLNGFAVTVTQQGVGDYFDLLQMEAGNNIYSKLTALATKLDADPGIAQTDYLASIGTYSNTGSVVTFGNPTLISEVGHGIQTGRLVTISNSTTTPSIDGNYVATRVDANNFTIDVITTVGGTADWDANFVTFQEAQAAFNTIVNKLNDDTGVSFQNYLLSEDFQEFEVLIFEKITNTSNVIIQFSVPFIEGPITIYKSIICDVQYAPEPFEDTSILKQVSESTVIFEDANFSRATVGFKTDLSPGFETVDFTKSGKGDWGFFVFSQHNWGGGFSGVPLRTYIPRQKQRCRYIQLQFLHNSARERYALYGFSYTFRPISERGYR